MQRRVIEAAQGAVEPWKLYSPWIVLGLGIAVTILTWRSVAVHESEEIGWATQLAAEAIRTDLREDMEWQRIGLDRLALLSETAGVPESLWTSNAELYIEHRPGCLAVEWIAVSGTGHVVFTKIRTRPLLAFNGVPTAAMDIARTTRTTVFSTTDAVGDGTIQFAVVHPVYVGDDFRGYVVSFFDAARSIDDNLADVTGLGFSFAVVFPAQEIEHALPQTNRQHEKWATTFPVPLPGVKWQLRVWPDPSTMVRIRSLLPLATLIVGMLLTLLAFLTFHFATRVARSSARIELANEALHRQIAERDGMEKELRRARDELEARVHVRTAELATTNALLQREIAEHQAAEDSLRQLTARLFQLRDEEQCRLARELHDGATQTLIALSMKLAIIRDAIPSQEDGARAVVSDSSLLLKQCTEELRTISYLLHPPLLNELGLAAALHDFVEGFEQRSGIRVSLSINPELGRFGQQMELTLFRVVQEALSNVRRHAQSRTAGISLESHSGLLHLEVSDAGRGIPSEVLAANGSKPVGLGITGMQERVRLLGGRFEILSGKTGTKIQVVLPVTTAHTVTKKLSVASRVGSVSGSTAVA